MAERIVAVVIDEAHCVSKWYVVCLCERDSLGLQCHEPYPAYRLFHMINTIIIILL